MPETALVIFDCDGVLIDSEVISATILIAELRAHGLALDMDHVARHFIGRSFPAVARELREGFGLDLPPGFEAGYRERLLAAFARELKPMPGVEALLDRMRLPVAVATSSSPERVTRSLALTGLAPRFDGRVFTASMVARGKPAPDLFLHVAATLGVAPAECLVIEDSLTGIRAARAAGMEVWRFTGGSHLAGPLAEEPEDARPDLRLARFDAVDALRPQFFRAPAPVTQ